MDKVPCLENIGSCGLHTFANALQNGAKGSSWKLDSVEINFRLRIC